MGRVHKQVCGLLYGVPGSLVASEGCFLASHYGLCSVLSSVAKGSYNQECIYGSHYCFLGKY